MYELNLALAFSLMIFWSPLGFKIYYLTAAAVLLKSEKIKQPKETPKFVKSNLWPIIKYPITTGYPTIPFKEILLGAKADSELEKVSKRIRFCLMVFLLFFPYMIISYLFIGGQIIPMITVSLVAIAAFLVALFR